MASKLLLRWGGNGQPLQEETAGPEVHPTSTAHHAVRKPKDGAGMTPATGREVHSTSTTPHTARQPKNGTGMMSDTSEPPTEEHSAGDTPMMSGTPVALPKECPAARMVRSGPCQPEAAAETGRPETSQEYAHRMCIRKNGFCYFCL